VDGAVIWFDHCDVAKWTADLVEDLVEEMGYETCGRIRFYYQLPILSVEQRNSLREICTDTDTEAMVLFFSLGHLFLNIYLDHEDSFRRKDWDDVVDFPVAELPDVVSPMKPGLNKDTEQRNVEVEDQPEPIMMVPPEPIEEEMPGGSTTRRKTSRVIAMEAAALSNSDQEDDADSDYNESVIVDSDYDISEGDDDLDHEDSEVVEDVKGKEQVKCTDHVQTKEPTKETSSKIAKEDCASDEEISEDDDLWEPDLDDDNLKLRFKTFREEDLKNPSFHAG
jgi:hypothetical protein